MIHRYDIPSFVFRFQFIRIFIWIIELIFLEFLQRFYAILYLYITHEEIKNFKNNIIYLIGTICNI